MSESSAVFAPARPTPPVPARPKPARPAPPGSAAPAPARPAPESFLEVRVRPGAVEIMEFHSHGRASRLAEALLRLGLDLSLEVESPCG